MTFGGKKREEGKRSASTYAAYVLILLFAVVFVYLRIFCGMDFFLVPSSSMEPTLKPGDYLVTFKQSTYHRGDIIVLKPPVEESGLLVKRIVGVAGDTVEIEGGCLFLNGEYASEPYLPEPMEFSFNPPYEVEQGHVFVMGDNRNNSEDSATWRKTAPIKNILGKVTYIYSPMDRMGRVRSYPLTNVSGT